MRARLSVTILLLLTLAFCWGLGWIAWGFSRAGGVVGWGLALSVAVLLVLTVWVTWREVLFGLAAARLGQRYSRERPPRTDREPEPTGRRPETADASRVEFAAARSALEDGGAESDWRAWYRMGLAYDACRDRRHARECVRRAIALEHGGTGGSATV